MKRIGRVTYGAVMADRDPAQLLQNVTNVQVRGPRRGIYRLVHSNWTVLFRIVTPPFNVPGRRSVAPSEDFVVWQFLHLGPDWRHLTRAARFIRRASKSPWAQTPQGRYRMLGAASMQRLAALGAPITGVQWVIYGDSAADANAIDYHPKEQEIDDDTEISEDNLFPDAQGEDEQ